MLSNEEHFLKLLVISHACVTPINQSFFVDVARLTGWQVDLVVPATWNTEYQANLSASRWKDFEGALHEVPVYKPGNIPLHVYKRNMAGLLRKIRPDAIYVHHEPYGLATLQVYLANMMVDRRPIGFYAAQNILKNYPIPFRWFERFVLRGSEFCFPVTEGALEVVRGKGYEGAAKVLPLALDKRVYHPKPEWAAAKREELGIAEDEFVIGYLGRLVEEKGLRSMMHATKALAGRRWRCILVGSGPFEQELRAAIAELGIAEHVLFIGYVPHEQAPGWLSLFDVLILASESRDNWREQFGRVIIEANACGTAVIGTESGEIGNVLRNTGGGLIVPEGDATALGAAMLELAQDCGLTRRLAEEGESAVGKKYDQVYLASQFANTIRNAVGEKGPVA